MQFLRTIFWVIIAVLAVIFSFKNWTPVPIKLWSGIEAVWMLPFLLLVVFLLGLVPPWLLHRFTRWSLRRKLETANRSLVETRAINEVAPTPYGATAVPPSSVSVNSTTTNDPPTLL